MLNSVDAKQCLRSLVLQLMGSGTDYVIDVAPGVDWTAVCAMLMDMKSLRPVVSAAQI